MTSRRIVVTGGAGFIGSHIVAALAAAGQDVVVLDSLHRHAHHRTPSRHDGVDYRWVDVADAHAYVDVIDGAGAVCHQAARVGLGVDFSDVVGYVRDNDAGTAGLLWALHRTGFAGRIVLASSMVVYGEGAYRCPEHGDVRPGPRRRSDLDAGRFEPPCPTCGAALSPTLVTEDVAVDPRNVYAATKVHQEHLCSAFGREQGVPVTALRYHNVYGPGMPRDTPYAGVASIFRSQLEAGDRPVVFEDGGQRRDFVHVADVARANILALTADVAVDGPLNVASGCPWTLLDMARTLARAHRRRDEPEVTGAYRLGDVRHVTASPERAAAQLGFRASIRPEVGLAEFATAPLRA